MEQTPQIGHLIEDGDLRRDAIHVAIAPVTAAVELQPGQHVGFCGDGDREWVASGDHNIGIVDPFLKDPIREGQRFWMFLYPGTITSLRHVWTHPVFKVNIPRKP